jgi:uncharacterized sulfatase
MLSRRTFSASLGAASMVSAQSKPRPNILWITCEDTGPDLPCYGDKYTATPNLDKLAARSLRYDAAWSTAPVCAPARTCIISGMYPPSTGSEHMRSELPLPAGMKMYPQYLRDAGYYATNNSKEDYNLAKPGQVWDDSSNKAHWRNRGSGQPFFSIFNFTITHESQIRRRPHKLVNDPAKVRVRAYHPDTPEVRHDWTQYYDNITTMDGMAGKVLAELDQDGLATDTIVFFYGDHGSGMPRSKRFPYNSGLQVPLLVHIPEKFRHLAPPDYRAGGNTDRLVSFVDLAPTLLSLAGVRAPSHFQGRAFLGEFIQQPNEFIHGFRGRMDERYDMMRSVRDKRYVYIRNYMPHRPYGQHVSYMFETPTTAAWKKLYDEGKLSPPKTHFWETKAPEELYDLQADRDETKNLAASPEQRATLERLRKAQRDHAAAIRDVGFLPEGEMHERSQGSTPYEVGHDAKRYPFERVFAAAEAASSLKPEAEPQLEKALADSDSAVRYWGVMGFLMRKKVNASVRKALADSSPYVRIAAAETLGRYGTKDDLASALAELEKLAPQAANGVLVSLAALNSIGSIGPKAASLKDKINDWSGKAPNPPKRIEGYVERVLEHLPAEIAG